MYELFENAPKTGKSPTVFAFPAARRLPEGRRPAGAGSLAAAPGAATRPDRGRVGAGRRPDPAAPALPGAGAPPRDLSPEPNRAIGGPACTRPGSATRLRATIAEATRLLREGDGEAKVLAGGQSLVPLMKLRFASPELLVDINNLPGLDYHRVDDDGTLRVGALCRHANLERSTLLADAAADDGRRGAPDRRPDRPHPRHPGRFAVPRRPAGRLGRRGHGAGRQRRRPGPERPPHDPDRRLRHAGRSRTSWLTTRSRSRRSSRRRRAGSAGGLPQARAPGR